MSTVEQQPVSERRRAPRWMWGVMVASLAVNLLVVGAVGGWAFRFWRDGGMAGAVVERLVRDLPRDKQDRIRGLVADNRSVLEPDWQSFREARKAVEATLLAEPFDRAKFETEFKALHQKEAEARARAAPILGEIAAMLTKDEREKILRRLRRGFGRFRGGHDGPPPH